jgi:hypothetical protein
MILEIERRGRNGLTRRGRTAGLLLRASTAVWLTLITGVAVAGAQKPRSSAQLPGQPAPTQIWKSKTTGYEYRVRVQGNTFNAEWVNVPPALARHGAYIRTECHRVGEKWIGTSRSYLPCSAEPGPKGRVTNWCRLVTRTEIDSMTPDQITGRGQSLRRFDCRTCKILETAWANFLWVPKAP